MKLKNTPSRKKFVPFAGAFIEVPVDANFLSVNGYGCVFATKETPTLDPLGYLRDKNYLPIELMDGAMLVAYVEDFGGAHIISIEDLMAGIA